MMSLQLYADGRPLGLQSLEQEVYVPELHVKGDVPKWLDGTYIYNGPAKFNVGDKYVQHWFDGLAMLHAFSFKDGHISYKNKFLRTSAYEKMIVEGSLDFGGYAQESKTTTIQSEAKFIPNANVNVAKFADSYVALTETPLPVIFDPKSLDTLGLFEYTDQLPKGGIWESAHPHRDARTGEVINYFVQFGPTSRYVVYRMKKGSKAREMIAEIPVAEPAYMHSFAVTPHYVILVEFPFVVNPRDLAKGGGFISHYHWKEGKEMRFIVINRASGDIVGEYFGDSVFAWHHINSFEDSDSLVIDLASYPDASTITNPICEDLQLKRVARFTRYHISLKDKKVLKEQLGPSIEMPRINYDRVNGKEYEYVYGIDDRVSSENVKTRGLVKIEAKTKKVTFWSEDGCVAEEPVFVPEPGDKREDDGVLLSVVLDTKSKRSFLLIMDAHKFKEIARADIPLAIPFGLHGDYFR